MVICLGQSAHLHVAQLMPLPFTISYFSKIQIGFTFLVPAYPGSPRQNPEGHKMVVVVVVQMHFVNLKINEHVMLSNVNAHIHHGPCRECYRYHGKEKQLKMNHIYKF